jgi:hypothetical protein
MFEHALSARKLTKTVFWNRKGVPMVTFMLKGTIITSKANCGTLKEFRKATKNNRNGMLTSDAVLFHDNARYSWSYFQQLSPVYLLEGLA